MLVNDVGKTYPQFWGKRILSKKFLWLYIFVKVCFERQVKIRYDG
jgi:hypothetical protein